jgi:hypothetical protein
VLVLCESILLVHVWAWDMMKDTHMLEEGGEFLILTFPIRLNSVNLCIKEALNHLLKFMEFVKNIRLVFKEIKPCEFTVVINERHIVLKFSNGKRGNTPYIKKHKLQGSH